MKIALWEPFPILHRLLTRTLNQSRTARSLRVEDAVAGGSYHLLLADRGYLPSVCAEVSLIPGGRGFARRETGGMILTGGMNRADAVTLSSIGEDRAMLCLQQEIALCGHFIGPFEFPIPFDRQYSLYKNLAAGFALSLAEILFGEEQSQ